MIFSVITKEDVYNRVTVRNVAALKTILKNNF